MHTTELAGRLDNLAMGRFHRRVVFALAFIFFFEIGDINSFSFAAPGIKEHLGITVDQIAIVTSAGFAGMFIGAGAGGWLADRLGRKKALIWSIAVYSVFSLANALGYDIPTLAGARLLTGVGLSAATAIAIAYLSETMPAASRGRIQALVLALGLLGVPAAAFFARGVIPLGAWGWRLVFVFGALGVLAIFAVARLPESPRWLLGRGRTDEATAVLRTIEEGSPGYVEPEDVPATEATTPAPAEPRQVTLGDLFAPRSRRRTIMLWVAWIFQTLGFYGFMSWVPTLLSEHGFGLVDSLTYSAVTTIGAAPGAFLGWLISDRLGRKQSIWIVSLLVALCGILYGLGFNNATVAVFGFLVGFFIQTVAALLYAYTPELYPTALRSRGSGMAYGIGRLANILGPFIVAAVLNGLGYVWVFVYIALCWVLTAVVVGFFGPNTARRGLEQLNPETGMAEPATRT